EHHEHGEFEVFYQPQVRLTDGLLVGAEALLRWRHPRDGLLSPAAFMPGLENRPISADVGQWVLQEACLQAARWRNAGAPEFRMGVNLFGSQFRSGNLVDKVRAATQTVGLPPSALELEITENIMLRHDEGIIAPLRQLRQEGVQVAFDDYGTGYASLSMLKRFPLTRLKIDKSFVQAMCGSHQDAAVIRAVLLLGNAFGFSVIAEGVETTEQADRLRHKGCEEAQGYLFGRPMPASDFAAHFGLSPPGAVALHREPEQTIGHRARLLVEGD
ncbi:MAG: EAL domain-containing protein, partial [Deltaproteobacteria bacterium]